MKPVINLVIDGINPDKQLHDFITSFENRRYYEGSTTHVFVRVVRYYKTDYYNLTFIS